MTTPINRREFRDFQAERAGATASTSRKDFSTLLKSLSRTSSTSNTSKTNKTEQISEAVKSASQKNNVDPNLILAVIHQESGFKECAESQCGAQGLMQLMPETAKEMGVTNSFDIAQNVNGGTQYLKQMLDRFGGDPKLALAAYNAGPNAVQKHGGIPPYQETQNYVKSIMGHYQALSGGKISETATVSSSVGVDSTGSAKQASDIASMISSAMIGAAPMNLPLPERKSNEEPPPPPPTAVRV
jgi:soluble lytic murein transglycosylase-like protein